MGTSIKIQAFKGEKTTEEQWDKFLTLFHETYSENSTSDEYMCEEPCHYCSYGSASINTQAEEFEEFKGSEINIHIYFLEVDPDEQTVLWGWRMKTNYKKAYQILMEYWDSLPDEEKEEIDQRLKECGC